MLIVTARNPLQERYGSDGYEQIRQALDAWAVVDGDFVLAIDDPADMDPKGLEAVNADQFGIQNAIRAFGQREPEVAQSVLLAGGNAILPFYSLNNPVLDRVLDADDMVLSDNPYGMVMDSADEQLAPS